MNFPSCFLLFSLLYCPTSFNTYIETHDPPNFPTLRRVVEFHFFGREISMPSGKEESLVLWMTSLEFVEGVEVRESIERIVVEEGRGMST
ncbi:uncharacterized protein BJ212DRAFT_1372612 [Suillus subaureus]|uniref:Uncharacterized protein n=1 Tax=Suillus subaureus TaxID=48587 RepID=A0A9P7JAS1_9AGAM|nr:uncharacterized protein BJ212DRAFT_1372612 [Suillus subaureus]KAG1811712.1 hypothetical protein BJ212DRAFT_1372612 [Suillus subaureus]